MTERPDLEPVRVATDDTVVLEVTIAAPVDVVWPWLRDPELIRRWHGWELEGLDEEIQFIYQDHAREGAQPYVLETMGGPLPGSYERGDRFELLAASIDAAADATVVRITRGPKGEGDDWAAMYDDVTQGWTSFLAQLKFAVELHRDATRRTVFLGVWAPPTPAARELLGIAGLRTGESYHVSPAPGMDLDGVVWFTAPGQTGLTVPAYGPGLVLAADKPGEGGATLASMVIVTTYGMSEADFAAAETAWQAWWAAHHPDAEPVAN